jgi:hypothetical protein
MQPGVSSASGERRFRGLCSLVEAFEHNLVVFAGFGEVQVNALLFAK